MYHARLLIGNTSSGIIEAASFGKYFINVGERQEGRLQSENVINASFNHEEIVNCVERALSRENFKGVNVYFKNNSAESIINIIRQFNEIL